MKIGSWELANPLILAPMAGVTDLPFRRMCREHGAAMAVSEMVTSDQSLWHTKKTQLRLNHRDEYAPISVQIAGTEPQQMADAAKYNRDLGAQIIDINMGCPAKKVCRKAAGSALLRDEIKVSKILAAVVEAVDLPVTLKIRTGWSPSERNAPEIARIAEAEGIQALAIHGRTRACGFKGQAETQTVTNIKAKANIPIIANGDMNSASQALQVLNSTGADAIMIGRGAQGWPWIFEETLALLNQDQDYRRPTIEQQQAVITKHLLGLYDFYGEFMGVRIARKHLGWYLVRSPEGKKYKQKINQAEDTGTQLDVLNSFFENKIIKNNNRSRESYGHARSFSSVTG